jgi:MFS family permease
MQLFQSLTHRPFAFLWSGQTLSRLGDSLYQIALAWWVLQKTGSAAAMGAVFIAAFIPKIIFLLIGGLSVDKLPRGAIMLIADLLRGAITFVVAILAFLQHLELWHIYLASLLFGGIEAFFLPAYTALLPQLTPAHLRSSANALTTLSAEFTGLLGPALGAFLITAGGPATAFALDGASFFISVLCLLPILKLAPPTKPTQSANPLTDLRQGFQTVLAIPWLWFTISILALLNFTGRSPMNVSLPFLVSDSLHAQVGTLGSLYSLFSLGSILGALFIGRITIQHPGRAVYGDLALVGLATTALGLPITIYGVSLAILSLGMALSISNLVWTQLLQDRIPAHLLGRIASINLLGSTSLLPLGFALVGWATDTFGPASVFIVGGLLTTAVSFIGLAYPPIRNLE